MFNWKQIQELELKNKKFFIQDLSLSLSVRIRMMSAGTSSKKKKCEFLPCEFFFSPPTFPFLILDSFYRRATIRFDFKPDRDFLILASSVQCENENERLPFSTSPISSIVRHSEEIKRHEEKTETLAYLYAYEAFFFFSFLKYV